MKFYNSFNELYSAGETRTVFNSQKLNWIPSDRQYRPGEETVGMSRGDWGFEVYDDNLLETPGLDSTFFCTVADSKIFWEMDFAGRVIKELVKGYCNKELNDVQIESETRDSIVFSRRLSIDEQHNLANHIDKFING